MPAQASRDSLKGVTPRNDGAFGEAWAKARAEKKNNEHIVGNQFFWDKLRRSNPNATHADLLDLAHQLEAQGQLAAAADAYQELITGPHFHQTDNKELRAHLAGLVARINRNRAEADALKRMAQLEAQGRPQPGRPKGLAPAVTPQRPPTPPATPQRRVGGLQVNKPLGPMMPMSPQDYRAELEAQAQEVQRRREVEKRRELLLEAKQVALAAAAGALERYEAQLARGSQVAYGRELQLDSAKREEERLKQFYVDLKEQGAARKVLPGGPLSGMDEYQRRRAQAPAGVVGEAWPPSPQGVEGRRVHYGPSSPLSPRDHFEKRRAQDAVHTAVLSAHKGGGGGAGAAGYPQRPSTAGPAAVGYQRDRFEQQQYQWNRQAAAANALRMSLPEHPFMAAGRPLKAWQPQPQPAAAKPGKPALKGAPAIAVRAPFSQPELD